MKFFSKLWFQQNVNRTAIARVSEYIENEGMALPSKVVSISGQIVTVKFEMDTSPWTLPQITIPKAEGPWVIAPTQVGDLGLTMPASVYLGGISGLGGGTATFRKRGNLSSTLVWVPVANKATTPPDQDAALVQGPKGVYVQTSDGTVKVVVSPTQILASIGSVTAVITASTITFTAPNTVVNGNLQVAGNLSAGTSGSGTATFKGDISTTGGVSADGDVKAGTVSLKTHVHSGVTSGGSNTGAPVP